MYFIGIVNNKNKFQGILTGENINQIKNKAKEINLKMFGVLCKMPNPKHAKKHRKRKAKETKDFTLGEGLERSTKSYQIFNEY